MGLAIFQSGEGGLSVKEIAHSLQSSLAAQPDCAGYRDTVFVVQQIRAAPRCG